MIKISRILGIGALGGALLTLLVVALPFSVAQPRFSNNIANQGANAGSSPSLRTVGTDTNINLNLVSKGAGCVQVNGACVSATSAAGNFTVGGNLVVIGTTQLSGAASTQVGTSGVFKLDGAFALFHNTTDAGTGADVVETTLHTFSLPGNSLTTAGQYVRIVAYHQTSANANTKRLRVYFGATVIGDSTAVAFNNQAIPIVCDVYVLTGVTQKAFCHASSIPTIAAAWGSGGAGTTGGYNTTLPAETLTGAITIRTTGTNGTATANDLVAKTTTITWYPQGQ